MRSGGVVGKVQETVACNRKPVPIRYPQPLSQGLSALTAPLFDRGRFCGNAIAAPQSGPRAICPAPRERRNAAGSRFFRRLRRFDQMGSPAQFTPGKGTMFLP